MSAERGQLEIRGSVSASVGKSELTIEGHGRELQIVAPNWNSLRALTGAGPPRGQRQKSIELFQRLADRSGFTLVLRCGQQTIATLSPGGRGGLTSKLAGVGSVRIRPAGVFRAWLERERQ